MAAEKINITCICKKKKRKEKKRMAVDLCETNQVNFHHVI